MIERGIREMRRPSGRSTPLIQMTEICVRTRTLRRIGRRAALLAVIPAIVAACGGGGPEQTVLSTRDGNAGSVLLDSSDHTLYTFTGGDCYGKCASAWPPLLAKGQVLAKEGSRVDASLLGTTRRRNGELQVTYDDHPLYLSAKDKRPGDSVGQGAQEFGGKWTVVLVDSSLAPQKAEKSCEPNCGY
jgi:predicted lipoprotein with Yx(FWY)xxD motif